MLNPQHQPGVYVTAIVMATGASDADEDGIEEDDDIDGDDDIEREHDADETPRVWYAVPVSRVLVVTLLGGWPSVVYWMYRWWSAYRISWGYSRHTEWQAVHARTGFRVSPVWRAVLHLYCYGMWVAVRREARLAGLKSWVPPWPGFAALIVASFVAVSGSLEGACLARVMCALLLVATQVTINQLSDSGGVRGREPASVAEVAWATVGLLLTLIALGGGRR